MLVFSPEINPQFFIGLNISMFLIRDLSHPAVRGPGADAPAGGVGAGGDGGHRGEQPGELHAASQPPPGQDGQRRGGAEGGGEPLLQLPVSSILQPEPPEVPAAAPGWRRIAHRAAVCDELLLPAAPHHQHPDQRQPAAGQHHRALP